MIKSVPKDFGVSQVQRPDGQSLSVLAITVPALPVTTVRKELRTQHHAPKVNLTHRLVPGMLLSALIVHLDGSAHPLMELVELLSRPSPAQPEQNVMMV